MTGNAVRFVKMTKFFGYFVNRNWTTEFTNHFD